VMYLPGVPLTMEQRPGSSSAPQPPFNSGRGSPFLPRRLARRHPLLHQHGHAGRRRHERRRGATASSSHSIRSVPSGRHRPADLLRQLDRDRRPDPDGPLPGGSGQGQTVGAMKALIGLQARSARIVRAGARSTSRSRTFGSATSFASGRASACRSTGESSRASRRSTNRCSPASRSRSRRGRRRGHRRDDERPRDVPVPRDTRGPRHRAGPDRGDGPRAQGSKAPIQRLADRIAASSCRLCWHRRASRSASGSRSDRSRG
jgi:hypothetical protein